MTLNEAIQHAEEVAETACVECADNHRQLAAWLRDYKRLLEQEPCEDAISRDMALEKMADYVASGYADSVEDFEEYSRIICQLPSVKPQEPQSGYWQKHTDASGNSWHTCPACGHVAYTLSHYCPDCGTRLETPS